MWSVGFFFSSRRRHTRLQGDWIQTCALPISEADRGLPLCTARPRRRGMHKIVNTPPRTHAMSTSASPVHRLPAWVPLRYTTFCLSLVGSAGLLVAALVWGGLWWWLGFGVCAALAL